MTFKLFSDPNYYLLKVANLKENKNKPIGSSSIKGFQVSKVDGFVALENRFIVGNEFSALSEVLDVDEIANAHGEWTAMGERSEGQSSEYIFLTDRFGYSPIFYSVSHDNTIVVSNSFQGAVLGLESLGIRRTLNVSYYSALIASNSPTFQNSHLHATMANEIRLLPAANALLVSDEGFSVVDRDLFGGISEITTYSEAIAKGINSVSNIVKTLTKAQGLSARITLTGGVDSRLCLSILAKADRLSTFGVSTIDPRSWDGKKGQRSINRDMVISNRIRRQFNLKWWTQPSRLKTAIDFQESLVAFQSYRSNFAYTFLPSASHTHFSSPVLSIRGGGGEILRVDASINKLAKEFEKSLNAEQNLEIDEGYWYANHILQGSALQGRLKEEVVDSIVSAYPYDYGNSFLERISYLYLSHRYRGHFSHQRQSTSTNDIILHPLSNSFFLKASQLINFNELANGMMVIDLFKDTSSGLLDFTFASDEWSQLLIGKIGSEDEYDSTEWQADHPNLSSGSVSEFSPGEEPGSRGRNVQFDQLEASIQYLTFAFEEIVARTPKDYVDEVKALHRTIMTKVRNKSYTAGYAVAKAASALDAFYLRAETGERREYECRRSVEDFKNEIIIPQIDTSPLSTPHDLQNQLRFPVGQVHVEIINHVLVARVEGAIASGGNLEYAFYIFCDGERIENRWFNPSPQATFPILSQGATYQVKVFVRRNGTKSVFAKISSQQIVGIL